MVRRCVGWVRTQWLMIEVVAIEVTALVLAVCGFVVVAVVYGVAAVLMWVLLDQRTGRRWARGVRRVRAWCNGIWSTRFLPR